MIADKKRKLLEKSMCENSLLIIAGRSELLRNGDVYYPFRQDSDFLMLTELNVPDLQLIARKENGKVEWILYSDPINEKEKLWGTSRLSYESLENRSSIKAIRSQSEWEKDLRDFTQKSECIYIREKDQKIKVR
jgi:Xaa-Pro aminopeptidase